MQERLPYTAFIGALIGATVIVMIVGFLLDSLFNIDGSSSASFIAMFCACGYAGERFVHRYKKRPDQNMWLIAAELTLVSLMIGIAIIAFIVAFVFFGAELDFQDLMGELATSAAAVGLIGLFALVFAFVINLLIARLAFGIGVAQKLKAIEKESE